MSRKTIVSLAVLFAMTEIMVFLSSIYGPYLLERSDRADLTMDGLLTAVSHFDAIRYITIAKVGYDYEIGRVSTIGFFPGYPIAVSLLARVSQVRTEAAAIIVSNICFFTSMFLMAVYGMVRRIPTAILQSVAAFALFPTTFFFRMPYSESLFLCFCLAFILGIEKHWSPLLIASIAGIASGIRPVGIALVIPLQMYVYAERQDQPLIRRYVKGAAATVLSCSGLLLFLSYNYVAFGDTLAFIKVQSAIRLRSDQGIMDKLLGHMSLEPLWSVYDTSSPAYWRIGDQPACPAFSLRFADPIIFLAVTLVILFGWWKRYLTAYEIALSLGLLAIPYLTRGYEMGMIGHGRYAAVCFPVYFVIGGILKKAGIVPTMLVCGFFAFYLNLYCTLFASGYIVV